MSNTLRRLLRNTGSLILALLLATVVWIAATLQSDPFSVQAFPGVSLDPVNQPEDTTIFEPIADAVTVQARAPRSVLGDLAASDFEATLDLSVVEPGVPTPVPVEVTTDNEGVRIVDWSPTEQNVHLEAIRSISVPVTIEVLGSVATGYQSSPPVVMPRQASVSGPEPLLSDVTPVSGSIEIAGARDDVVAQVPIRPVNAEGTLVPGLEWGPRDAQARVRVARRLGFKPDVEVVPDLRGEPATGYRRGSVVVEPSTVTLAGVPSALEDLPGFVETDPISVTNATQDLVIRSPLTVPQDVVVVGVDFVTVTVEVLPILSSRAMTATVEVRGVQPEWVAVASPSVVDVILEGPDPILTNMTSDDLRVFVDVFGLGRGTQRVEPDVLAPEGVTVVSIIPETIEVVLGPARTPTPSPTVSVPLTPTVTTVP